MLLMLSYISYLVSTINQETRYARENSFNDITQGLTEKDIESKFKKVDKYGRRYNTVPVHAPGETTNGVPRIKKYADEHKGKKIQDIWSYIDPAHPLYPTEKNLDMLKMIVQQSSNKNSLVMDCFAGSGSTLLAAEQTGRRWLGVDQSEYSAKVIKKRFNGINFNCVNYRNIVDKVAIEEKDKSEDVTTSLN